MNAVELLPIAEFGNTGSSWGYDPSQIFAVDNVQYGGPEGFKNFVKACHARGLAVLLDVVHNHYGPSQPDMWDLDGYTGGGLGGGIYFNEGDSNLSDHILRRHSPQFQQQSGLQFYTGQLQHVAWGMPCGRFSLGHAQPYDA